MTAFFQFALLGLGVGGAYGISGIGLTQIYRGSGVLNLSQGAISFFSGVFFVWADKRWGLGFAPSAILAIGVGAAIGALIQILVMRRLRRAASLVRMIATLGVFAVLQQAVPLLFGSDFGSQEVGTFYPSGRVRLGSVAVPYDRLIVVGVTIALGLALRMLMDRSRFGLATTASAENPLVASSLGVDPGRTELMNWMIGSGLAGLAGVLLVPILGSLNATPLLLLIVPTLAAAMIGRFSSYALTITGGLAIGVGQSLLIRYQTNIFGKSLAGGWPDALPFIIIIVVLVVGGTPFPQRSEIAARLPRVGRTRVHPLVGIVTSVILAALVLGTASNYLAASLTTIAGLAIVGVSLVVVTGLAGQTSLAQLAISGVGALVAARLSHSEGWPFLAVLVVATLAAAITGGLFALPAFRTRGPTLAIATIGVGIAIQDVVLQNGTLTLTGVYGGTPVHSPSIFGINIDGATHPQRYAALAIMVLGLCAVAVSNLRAGPIGRRLLAMRSSERAAAASGISLSRATMGAFVLAVGLAGLGGVLMAFQQDSVTYDRFDILSSLYLVIFSLIGGIGYVLGPIIGALLSPSGLLTYFFASHDSVQRWLITAGGIGLILVLITHPNGQGELSEILSRRLFRRRRHDIQEMPARAARPSAALTVQGLTVQYGRTTAVDGLSLRIEPGKIVGLIGPNGAGKTTAIDAISGFAAASAGVIRLGDEDLTRVRAHVRAAAGVARTFQTVEPFEDLTVAENLAVPLERIRWWYWLGDFFHRRPVALPAEVREEAKSLGMDDLDVEPDSLSQGQRRLLGVMRAIAASPSVLLLDEPAAGLNQAETKRLGEILRQVASERQIGMLLVEHDLSIVSAICDRVVAIDFGRTIFEGPPAQALEDPGIRAAYLGDLSPDAASVPEPVPANGAVPGEVIA